MGFTYILCDRQRGEFYSIVNTASRLVRGNSGTLVRRQSPAEPPSHDPIAMAGLQQWARTSRHCRRVRLATKPEFMLRLPPGRSFSAGPARKEQPPPACLAGGGCFIDNSDTHLPTQGWPPALPRRGRDDTPYITPCGIPAYYSRLLSWADQLSHQQRLPPDPLPRPRRDQPQPGTLGQPRRHRRPLPQRLLLLRRHFQGHRGPLRHLYQPQAIPRQPRHGGHQDGEHQPTIGTRAKSPGPPPPRHQPLAPLCPHSQLT